MIIELIIAAISGGGLIKIHDKYFLTKKEERDSIINQETFLLKMVTEFRETIKDNNSRIDKLQEEIDRLEKELREYKGKYLKLKEEYNLLNGKYNNLKNDFDILKHNQS